MDSRKVIFYVSRTAIFGGIAAILYCVPGLQFQLPFVAPGFMSVHLDDIPILLSSFAYGPLLGFFEILLKTIIKLPMSQTMYVGELGDVMFSLALVMPASIIYSKNRTIKGAIIGTLVGLLSTLFFSTVINLYTIFPLYKIVLGFKDGFIGEQIGGVFGWENMSDYDIRLAALLLPFNLIKNGIVIGATFICYKPLRYILEKAHIK